MLAAAGGSRLVRAKFPDGTGFAPPCWGGAERGQVDVDTICANAIPVAVKKQLLLIKPLPCNPAAETHPLPFSVRLFSFWPCAPTREVSFPCLGCRFGPSLVSKHRWRVAR